MFNFSRMKGFKIFRIFVHIGDYRTCSHNYKRSNELNVHTSLPIFQQNIDLDYFLFVLDMGGIRQ